MDYLQYDEYENTPDYITSKVLNLVINGLPSIQRESTIRGGWW